MTPPPTVPGPIAVDRVISVTELQKLSLKRLRELDLASAPLVVLDRRSRQGRFVIVDYGTWLAMAEEPEGLPPRPADVDFDGHGLFWDRPGMTNRAFTGMLEDPDHPEHRWAWSRVLERLPSGVVTRMISLEQLRRVLQSVRLRPRLRAAWEGACEFWTEETRSRPV